MRLATKDEVKKMLVTKKGNRALFPSEDQWTPVYNAADDSTDYIQVGDGGPENPGRNGYSYAETCQG